VFARDPTWTGLGLFLDTYDNAPGKHVHKHPYVSAFMSGGDHKFSYSELEADDKSLEDPSHAASRAHAGCHARLRQYGRDPKIVTVRISYTRAVQKLVVKLFLGRRRDQYRSAADYAWQQCFALHSVDIPPGYWLAASASTGQLTDTHEVLSIETRAASPPAEGGEGGVAGAPKIQVPPPGDELAPPAPILQSGRVIPPQQVADQGEPPTPDPARAADASSVQAAQAVQASAADASSVRVAQAAQARAETQAASASQALDGIKGDLAAFKREVRLSLQTAKDDYAKHDDVSAVQRASTASADSIKSQLAGKAAAGDVQRLQRKLDEAVQSLQQRMEGIESRPQAQVSVSDTAAPTWLVLVALASLGGCLALGAMFLRLQHRMRKMHLP